MLFVHTFCRRRNAGLSSQMRGRCSQRNPSSNATEQQAQLAPRIFSVRSSTSDDQVADALEATITTKTHKRLLWKFTLLAILCYIDRTSLAFAAPGLKDDLHFSSATYGLGAGVFFIGYIAVQVCNSLLFRGRLACLEPAASHSATELRRGAHTSTALAGQHW